MWTVQPITGTEIWTTVSLVPSHVKPFAMKILPSEKPEWAPDTVWLCTQYSCQNSFFSLSAKATLFPFLYLFPAFLSLSLAFFQWPVCSCLPYSALCCIKPNHIMAGLPLLISSLSPLTFFLNPQGNAVIHSAIFEGFSKMPQTTSRELTLLCHLAQKGPVFSHLNFFP